MTVATFLFPKWCDIKLNSAYINPFEWWSRKTIPFLLFVNQHEKAISGVIKLIKPINHFPRVFSQNSQILIWILSPKCNLRKAVPKVRCWRFFNAEQVVSKKVYPAANKFMLTLENSNVRKIVREPCSNLTIKSATSW